MKIGKRFTVVAMMLVVGSLSIITTTASAELTNILPEGTEANPLEFSGHSEGVMKFISPSGTIECAEAPMTGQIGGNGFTSGRLGLVIIEFLGCKNVGDGSECLGLEKGEPTKHIKVHAEVHIWPGRLVNASGEVVLHLVTLVFLLLHVHFTCSFGLTLFLLLGCFAVLITQLQILLTVVLVSFAENAKKEGINDITEVENEKGEFIKCELKSALNEGTESSKHLVLGKFVFEKFKQGGKEVSILVMG